MNDKYLDSHNPPYNWISAFGICDKNYKVERDKLLKKFRPYHPFLPETCFKVMQIASNPWDILYTTMVIYSMTWTDIKTNIVLHLQMIEDERKDKIKIETIEDIALSYTVYNPTFANRVNGCIDSLASDPFTVIPENAILFIHQVKYKNRGWIFHYTK
jgi:hypothetical protein